MGRSATKPIRFRQCQECRGNGSIAGRATAWDDEIANSTDCRACGGEGGEYFPLHGPDYDPLNRLAKARAAYLRDRYDTRPVLPSATGIWPARCEDSARKYGELRQRVVSPEFLP